MAKKIDWFAVDTAVRVSAPLALEVAVFRGVEIGLLKHAQKLRGLAPIVNRRSAAAAQLIAAAAYTATDAAERGGGVVGVIAADAVASAFDAARDVAIDEAAARTIAIYNFGAADAARAAAADDYTIWQRVYALGVRSAYFIRMLDLDVHSGAELETAMVATDYVLERGGGYDDKALMDALQRFKPMIAGIEATGFRAPSGLDNRFRRPIWSALPGAEAAYPDWSTFMAWPVKITGQWLDLLLKQY